MTTYNFYPPAPLDPTIAFEQKWKIENERYKNNFYNSSKIKKMIT